MKKRLRKRLPSLEQWIGILFGLALAVCGLAVFGKMFSENREMAELCFMVSFSVLALYKGAEVFFLSLSPDEKKKDKEDKA